MNALLDLLYLPRTEWKETGDRRPVHLAFDEVVRNRYLRVKDLSVERSEERRFGLRVNANMDLKSVPFAALIAPDQDRSGPYGGMSFVIFPSDFDDHPALISMVVGTNGLAPDEVVLGRPGHARKCAAIARWVNSRGSGAWAWTKNDPVRTDLPLPQSARERLGEWKASCERYGNVIYTTVAPPLVRTTESDAAVSDVLFALLDLFFSERGIDPMAAHRPHAEQLRSSWMSEVLPSTSDDYVIDLLRKRRFVVLEGPPGTGKTEMARRILSKTFGGNGTEIQFHPGTTYENFVGGLAPAADSSGGLRFEATPGHLMRACRAAKADPSRPYLLVVDEINRADLAKVLGEAIYLFEPGVAGRRVDLAHEFDGFGRQLELPNNLCVLATMNTADRSIAILDIAIRRRFAFVGLWPQVEVVRAHSGERLYRAFEELVRVFVEHAPDDAFHLLPGHAYFLGDDSNATARFRTEVGPLLSEYLAQGYVSSFADEVRSYMDFYAREV